MSVPWIDDTDPADSCREEMRCGYDHCGYCGEQGMASDETMEDLMAEDGTTDSGDRARDDPMSRDRIAAARAKVEFWAQRWPSSASVCETILGALARRAQSGDSEILNTNDRLAVAKRNRAMLVANQSGQSRITADDVQRIVSDYGWLIDAVERAQSGREVEQSEYTKKGGKWLAAARSWVQWHCRNGSEVTWGSNDVLQPSLTIRQVEELAAWVADAANSEADEMRRRLEDERTRRFRSEFELTARAEAAEAALAAKGEEAERLTARWREQCEIVNAIGNLPAVAGAVGYVMDRGEEPTLAGCVTWVVESETRSLRADRDRLAEECEGLRAVVSAARLLATEGYTAATARKLGDEWEEARLRHGVPGLYDLLRAKMDRALRPAGEKGKANEE